MSANLEISDLIYIFALALSLLIQGLARGYRKRTLYYIEEERRNLEFYESKLCGRKVSAESDASMVVSSPPNTMVVSIFSSRLPQLTLPLDTLPPDWNFADHPGYGCRIGLFRS